MNLNNLFVYKCAFKILIRHFCMYKLMISNRNETRFKSDSEAAVKDIHIFEHSRSSQSAPEDVDRNGVMYFGLMSDLALGCWNTNNFPTYGGNSIEKVVVNSNTLQFASGLKVLHPFYFYFRHTLILQRPFLLTNC